VCCTYNILHQRAVLAYNYSAMKLRSIESMPDVKGKNILIRVDHNVTFDPATGKLKDDRKLKLTLKTIEYLLDRGARLILMTHVGRPKGKVVEELRTRPIAEHLKTISDKISVVKTVGELFGDNVDKEVQSLKNGEILYLENVRFFSGEKENDDEFCKRLAKHGEFFVNEAFPSLHVYEEGSTCGTAKLLPAYAGFYLQEEIKHLGSAIDNPKKPLVLILSGAKMKTKITVIKRFLDLADHILLGGCIANTFIAARGFDVGGSRHEEGSIELARDLMLESELEGKATIQVPRDAIVATEAGEEAQKLNLPVEDISGDMKIFDIGKVTIERYKKEIESAKTIIWNGPLGMYEYNRFSHATKRIAESVCETSKKGAFTIIGGGDTLDFHSRYDYPLDSYGFVSAGGGAMLEFLSAEKPLPGLIPMMEEEAVAV
jgi:phosphoglycerate kinase